MINKAITFFFKQRHIMWFVFLLLGIYGYISCTRMTVEAYPELSDVTVQVSTQVPGLAAEEIEKQITTPLEHGFNTIQGLATIRSSSTFALSLITMVFRDGSEDYFVRERTRDRLTEVVLPPGARPQLDPVTGSGGEIYRYTLESESKNLMELSELQRWVVMPALKRVTGVIDVNNFGGFTKEFRLEIDPQQMQRYNVVLKDVADAISNNTANAGGGRITRGDQSYIIWGLGQIHTLTELGQVVVSQKQSVPILVRDLGKLEFGHQEREGILGKNYTADTIEGIVQMLKYENPSHVLEGVHAEVAELQKMLEPMDVKIVPYIDRDNLVHRTIEKVSHTVLEGIGLVCIVLVLFLGSLRSALIAATAIPVSLVTIFIIMAATKMPANLFSLGAIDFGVIVDGAIVVMEAILRRREAFPEAELSQEDTLRTTGYVARPIFFATLIIISAYLPLFAFERAEGKLFAPMAYTVSFALLGALICSMVLIPGLAYAALRKPRKIFHNRPLLWITERYQILLSRLLARPTLAYLIGFLTLLTVLVLGVSVGREFLPDLDEGALWLQVDMPSGLSLEKANSMAGELRRAIIKHPEVSYVVTQLGRSDEGTDPWSPSHIEVPVGLKHYSEWPDGENKTQFIAKLRTQFDKMPGYTIGISQPIIDNVNDVIAGTHSALVLRIYGNNLKENRRIGNQIVSILKEIPETASASLFQRPPIPHLVVKVDRERAARYGINAADIVGLIETGTGGAPVALVYVGQRYYNVTVRFPKQDKNSVPALGNLFLNSSTGAKILLSQVANIQLKTGEGVISHEKNERVITVRIDTNDRDLARYLAIIQKKIDDQVHYDHRKTHFEWGGQFESEQRAQKRITFIFAIVFLLMTILLFFQFGKLRLAFLILGVVPMATLGGLIALHLTGETLNVATGVGFIALFGVAVQNGIIMIANICRVKKEGLSLEETVITGATERLRPVLMTATVASFGMLPAALATGVGTDVQRGLATVVVGGLAIATLLTLFILPTYYFVLERFYESKHWPSRFWRKH